MCVCVCVCVYVRLCVCDSSLASQKPFICINYNYVAYRFRRKRLSEKKRQILLIVC